jgi:hypothetical protein
LILRPPSAGIIVIELGTHRCCHIIDLLFDIGGHLCRLQSPHYPRTEKRVEGDGRIRGGRGRKSSWALRLISQLQCIPLPRHADDR